jgi:hypothetical protein
MTMMRRLFFLSFCIVVAGLDLPDPFAGRLSARDIPPVYQPIINGFPQPFAPIQDTDAFQTWPPAPGNPTSVLLLTGDGRVRFVNPRNGATTLEMQPLGPAFHDPLSVAVFSFNGGPAPDTLFAGPAVASSFPFVGWSLSDPPRLLGETQDDWIHTSGIRVVVTNVDGDRTPEVIMASGPGRTGSLAVQFLGRNLQTAAGPFGPDHQDGIFVSAGDLTGDGIGEIVTTSDGPGGLLRILDIAGDDLRTRGEGFPYGPNFPAGIRTAVGDVNGDGVGDLIVAPKAGPPEVMVFTIRNGQAVKIADFLAFEPTFTGGVSIAPGLADGRPFLAAASGGETRIYEPGPGGLRVQQAIIVRLGEKLMESLASYTPPPQR